MIEKIDLWKGKEACSSYMTTFLLPSLTPRPAVLVIPGGGYTSVCEKTEGPPAALAFNRLGFHAFVLNYRVAPNRFPAPLAL